MVFVLGFVGLSLIPLWVFYPVKILRYLTIILIALSLLCYGYLGAYSAEKQYRFWQTHPEQKQRLLMTLKSPDKILSLLQAQVQKNPKDQKARRLLAQAYLRAQDYSHALQYAQGLDQEDQLTVALIQLEARFRLPGAFRNQEHQHLARLLIQYPNSVPLLSLAAAVDAKQGAWSKALMKWRKLAGILPQGSQAWRLNNQAIEQVLKYKSISK